MINTCTKFEFNPSTSWGSYARHRHNLLHGARSTTDIKPWHKHTTGELKKYINLTFSKALKDRLKLTIASHLLRIQITTLLKYKVNLFEMNY